MRKVKIIMVEGRGEVTVKEVSPWDVVQAWDDVERLGGIMRLLDGSLQPSLDEVKTWYASEIEQVVDAWLEVNASFFGIAAKLRLDGVVRETLAAMASSLPVAFASSLRQAMPELGSTDGLSL